MKTINRREALRRTSWVMGGTLAAPTIMGLMQGCTAQPDLTWTPVFFTEDQARVIMTVADIILPKTDTPAASELGVPKLIEDIVSLVMEQEAQERFMALMATFQEECLAEQGKGYNDLNEEERLAFVTSQHDKIAGKPDMPGNERPFIWQIKEMAIAGYFTTEVGMTQILQYSAIPTRYDGCIPLEEAGGRTWAT